MSAIRGSTSSAVSVLSSSGGDPSAAVGSTIVVGRVGLGGGDGLPVAQDILSANADVGSVDRMYVFSRCQSRITYRRPHSPH